MTLRTGRMCGAVLGAAAIACAGLALTRPASATDAATGAGATATLIDRELRVRSIRVVGLDDVELTVIDDRGERRRVPIGELIALVPTPQTPTELVGVGTTTGFGDVDVAALRRKLDAGEFGFVETSDGQRIIGDPGTSSGDADSVTWVHPRFGPVRIDLDRVLTVAMPGSGARALTLERDRSEDVLSLLNGDRLRGLIASLSDPVVVEQDDARVEVPRERVAGATLANPRTPREGRMVWLLDGTVARVSSATSISGETLDLSLEDGGEGEYSMTELRALGFDAARVVPLSDLTPRSQTGEGDRRVAMPIELVNHPDDLLAGSAPTLGAMDIKFPGPMRVEWAMPRGTERIAMTIVLDEGTAPWGDCEVVILVDGREIFRDHLEQGRPAIAVNEPIRGGTTMVIAVEPGNYGPISDRIVLRRPLMLVAPPR